MKERFFIRAMSIILLMVLLLFHGAGHAAENIDPLDDGSQYAYGENVGWLNAEPGGDGGTGVEVLNNELTGYIWAENVGWISLSCENTTSCATVDYRVENGGGNLVGYGWGENVGWISFSCEWIGSCGIVDYGVTIDGNGNFNGWAWGENIGWIHFKNDAPISYKVQTSWASSVNDTDGDGVPDSSDNCPTTPNGPVLGTCINCSTGTTGETCAITNDCGTGESCAKNQENVCGDDFDNDGLLNSEDNCMCVANPLQEDNYPPQTNGCGDACDCEGDFEPDGDVDGTDAFTFKQNFFKCQTACDGDFICDGDVDGSDAFMFKKDFFRPNCPTNCNPRGSANWCVYQ